MIVEMKGGERDKEREKEKTGEKGKAMQQKKTKNSQLYSSRSLHKPGIIYPAVLHFSTVWKFYVDGRSRGGKKYYGSLRTILRIGEVWNMECTVPKRTHTMFFILPCST